jgi:hypothetical protein
MPSQQAPPVAELTFTSGGRWRQRRNLTLWTNVLGEAATFVRPANITGIVLGRNQSNQELNARMSDAPFAFARSFC